MPEIIKSFKMNNTGNTSDCGNVKFKQSTTFKGGHAVCVTALKHYWSSQFLHYWDFNKEAEIISHSFFMKWLIFLKAFENISLSIGAANKIQCLKLELNHSEHIA